MGEDLAERPNVFCETSVPEEDRECIVFKAQHYCHMQRTADRTVHCNAQAALPAPYL